MQPFPRLAPVALVMLAALVALTLLAGCGKKAWPEPSAPEDAFSFVRTQGRLSSGCLMIETRVAGAWRNLSAVHLELAWDDCEGCPFRVMETREFVPGDAFSTIVEGRLALTACGLDPAKSYRWRLRGKSIHKTLRDVRTEVMTTAP
jgi:hypothetical protein